MSLIVTLSTPRAVKSSFAASRMRSRVPDARSARSLPSYLLRVFGLSFILNIVSYNQYGRRSPSGIGQPEESQHDPVRADERVGNWCCGDRSLGCRRALVFAAAV